MENPILMKELRSRMRGSKAYWVLLVYLVVLSFALVIAYLAWWHTSGYSGGSFVIGRLFFRTLFYVQVGLVCLITPGLTAGAITLEKEQRTYDLLVMTSMKARSMIAGKLVSAISFVVLLMVSSVPLVSVCFLLGGVSPGEVFFSYLVLLLAAFMYGSLGLMWSSVARNTTTATLMTYATVIVLFAGTLLPLAPPTEALRAVNPAGALQYAMSVEQYFTFHLPAWIASLILNGLAGILFLMVSIRKVDSYDTDTSLGLRLQSLLLYSAVLFFVFGWLFGISYSKNELSPDDLLMVVWFVILSVLLVLTPIFTTGEPDQKGRNALRLPIVGGWGSLFRARLESGLPFMLLLLGVSTAMFVAGYPMTGQGLPPMLHLYLPLAAILVLVVVAAFGGIELLLSCLLKSRWTALASGYLIMAGLTLLPLVVLPYSGRAAEMIGFRPQWLPLYLSPHMALASLFPTLEEGFPDPTGGEIPFFCITTLLYALIAALVLIRVRGVVVRRWEGWRRVPRAAR